jgi:hypothetical protein
MYMSISTRSALNLGGLDRLGAVGAAAGLDHLQARLEVVPTGDIEAGDGLPGRGAQGRECRGTGVLALGEHDIHDDRGGRARAHRRAHLLKAGQRRDRVAEARQLGAQLLGQIAVVVAQIDQLVPPLGARLGRPIRGWSRRLGHGPRGRRERRRQRLEAEVLGVVSGSRGSERQGLQTLQDCDQACGEPRWGRRVGQGGLEQLVALPCQLAERRQAEGGGTPLDGMQRQVQLHQARPVPGVRRRRRQQGARGVQALGQLLQKGGSQPGLACLEGFRWDWCHGCRIAAWVLGNGSLIN